MTQMECGCELEAGCNRLFLMWPAVVAHRIDERSPLYAMGPQDVLRSQFEIIVTLEGTVEETSNTIQVWRYQRCCCCCCCCCCCLGGV